MSNEIVYSVSKKTNLFQSLCNKFSLLSIQQLNHSSTQHEVNDCFKNESNAVFGVFLQRLTTYVARHTFATVLKRGGASTAKISEAMGHDSERTTQIYLDSFENDVLDDTIKALL